MKDYVDAYGLIAQAPPHRDGGDTAQREGMYISGLHWAGIQRDVRGLKLRESYKRVVAKLMRYGNGRRHSDENKWYGDWNRFSRDQAIAFLIGMFNVHLYVDALKFFLRHLTRGLLFMTNTRHNFQYKTKEEHLLKSTPDVEWDYSWKLPDLTGPEFWNIYLRGFSPIWLPIWLVIGFIYNFSLLEFAYPYLLMCLFDVEMLLSSIVKVCWYARTPSNDDDSNHIMVLLFSKRFTTPISFLARKIYRLRPRSAAPEVGYQSTFGPQCALDSYFRKEKGDAPINEVYRPILEHEL